LISVDFDLKYSIVGIYLKKLPIINSTVSRGGEVNTNRKKIANRVLLFVLLLITLFQINSQDNDQLTSAAWGDLIEIDKFNITSTYGGALTTAICASGDYLFTAYSSRDGGSTNGISGIRSYKLADTLELIRLDGTYSYEEGIEVGTPVSGFHTDGEFLYLIRGDLSLGGGHCGGIEVFSIDENF